MYFPSFFITLDLGSVFAAVKDTTSLALTNVQPMFHINIVDHSQVIGHTIAYFAASVSTRSHAI